MQLTTFTTFLLLLLIPFAYSAPAPPSPSATEHPDFRVDYSSRWVRSVTKYRFAGRPGFKKPWECEGEVSLRERYFIWAPNLWIPTCVDYVECKSSAILRSECPETEGEFVAKVREELQQEGVTITLKEVYSELEKLHPEILWGSEI